MIEGLASKPLRSERSKIASSRLLGKGLRNKTTVMAKMIELCSHPSPSLVQACGPLLLIWCLSIFVRLSCGS